MRTTKKDVLKVDPALPVDTSSLVVPEGDCLGREYDAKASECLFCSASTVCFLKFNETIDRKEQAIQEKHTLFLDKTDFAKADELVPKIVQLIKMRNDVSIHDMVATIKAAASTEDEVAVTEWLRNFVKNNGLRTDESGILSLREATA